MGSRGRKKSFGGFFQIELSFSVKLRHLESFGGFFQIELSFSVKLRHLGASIDLDWLYRSNNVIWRHLAIPLISPGQMTSFGSIHRLIGSSGQMTSFKGINQVGLAIPVK